MLLFPIDIAERFLEWTENLGIIVQIPPPEFVIFYNGEKDMPEETPLKLSDMYRLKVEDPKLQLEAVMLNISGSNNSRLKEACRTLKDYAVYTDKIRLYSKEQTWRGRSTSRPEGFPDEAQGGGESDQEKHICLGLKLPG